jgi:hypothetical protein
MKVVYRETIFERLLDEQKKALINMEKIEYVVLSQKETEELNICLSPMLINGRSRGIKDPFLKGDFVLGIQIYTKGFEA